MHVLDITLILLKLKLVFIFLTPISKNVLKITCCQNSNFSRFGLTMKGLCSDMFKIWIFTFQFIQILQPWILTLSMGKVHCHLAHLQCLPYLPLALKVCMEAVRRWVRHLTIKGQHQAHVTRMMTYSWLMSSTETKTKPKIQNFM